jgi:microcompartment protein CcmK/EutM
VPVDHSIVGIVDGVNRAERGTKGI